MTGPEENSPPASEPPAVELTHLQEAWQRNVLSAVQEKSIPTASMLAEARPIALDDDTLTIEFPPSASFHRKLAEEPKSSTLLRDALYQLTGRRLNVVFALGEGAADAELDEPAASEEDIYQLVKETFDAREVDE